MTLWTEPIAPAVPLSMPSTAPVVVPSVSNDRSLTASSLAPPTPATSSSKLWLAVLDAVGVDSPLEPGSSSLTLEEDPAPGTRLLEDSGNAPDH